LPAAIIYHDGFTAAADLLVCGEDGPDKARVAAEMVFARTRAAGFTLRVAMADLWERVELAPWGVPDGSQEASDPRGGESATRLLRLTVEGEQHAAVRRFTREIKPLLASGPPGLMPLVLEDPPVRPRFAFWPTQLPRALIEPVVEVRPARSWK
jgi:hypothetical protein